MSDGSLNLNLTRSEKSVWDKPGFTAALSTYDQERWLAVGWGSALTLIGARRGGITGSFLALVGTGVAVRAAMGRHDFRTANRWLTDAMRNRGFGGAKDVVADASEESFPASDSPSWTPTAGARTER